MRVPIGEISLNVWEDGAPGGAPLVFVNPLGTNLQLWDRLVALLPPTLRIVRFDMRGHGWSEVPAGPYRMDELVADAELLLDELAIRDAVSRRASRPVRTTGCQVAPESRDARRSIASPPMSSPK